MRRRPREHWHLYWSRYCDRARIAESQLSSAAQADTLLVLLESRRQAADGIGVMEGAVLCCAVRSVSEISLCAEALFLEAWN